MGDELIDTPGQLFDRAKRASADGLVGDQRKEAFDVVEPRTVGRNGMHVPAALCCQPRLGLGLLVTAIVVHDGGEHCAIEYVQGGQQCRGAVTNVVVGNAFVAEARRQYGLRAFECLTLALLVGEIAVSTTTVRTLQCVAPSAGQVCRVL